MRVDQRGLYKEVSAERGGLQAQMVRLVLQAPLGSKAHPDPPDSRDSRECRAFKVITDRKVQSGQRVRQDLKGPWVFQDQPGLHLRI